MTDPQRTIAILKRLAAMNIQLSIDDYGTGHSSLAYMRRLPVHELKIDRSFVQHLAVDDQDLQIVRSTIDLGHSLGLRVVAEGIEDARTLTLLKAHACDLVQGFHLGRPAPPDALLEQLRNLAAHPATPKPRLPQATKPPPDQQKRLEHVLGQERDRIAGVRDALSANVTHRAERAPGARGP